MGKMVLAERSHPTVFRRTKKLVESRAGADGKRADVLIVEGIFGKVNARNENNRRYPKSVWDTNLSEESMFSNRLGGRCVLGELEHPESGNTHLAKVSHLITRAWVESIGENNEYGVEPGEYVMGRAEILPTDAGKNLRVLFDCNVSVGISSRGRGNVRNVDGVDEVQNDYELETWDFVYLPSVKEAYPRAQHGGQAESVTEQEIGNRAEEPTADIPQTDAPVDPGVDPAADPAAEVPAEPEVDATPDWKAEAEEVIRAMEDQVGRSDMTGMIELLPRGINVVDQLASLDDEEAVKLKAQATSLMRVLSNRIMELEGSKTADAEDGDEVSDEEVKTVVKKAEKVAKKESVISEGDLTDLATTLTKGREKDPDKQGSTIYRGELEAALNKAGHEPDDDLVGDLADELKSQGNEVDPDTYEESTQEESIEMKSNELIEKLVSQNDALKQRVADLEKGTVPAARYEAAKKLVAKMRERLEGAESKLQKEESRVRASLQLIHKMVSEEKTEDEPVEEKKFTKKDGKFGKKDEEDPKADKDKKTESEEVVEDKPEATESKDEEPKVEESKAPAKPVVTEDSKDRKRRLRNVSEGAPAAPAAPSFMDQVISRIS